MQVLQGLFLQGDQPLPGFEVCSSLGPPCDPRDGPFRACSSSSLKVEAPPSCLSVFTCVSTFSLCVSRDPLSLQMPSRDQRSLEGTGREVCLNS